MTRFLMSIFFSFFPESYAYHGQLIGDISNPLEGIAGSLYSVDQNTVYLHNFKYTGKDPGM